MGLYPVSVSVMSWAFQGLLFGVYEQSEKEGYEIESVTRKGYRLFTKPGPAHNRRDTFFYERSLYTGEYVV